MPKRSKYDAIFNAAIKDYAAWLKGASDADLSDIDNGDGSYACTYFEQLELVGHRHTPKTAQAMAALILDGESWIAENQPLVLGTGRESPLSVMMDNFQDQLEDDLEFLYEGEVKRRGLPISESGLQTVVN